jgi:hypothetical protein
MRVRRLPCVRRIRILLWWLLEVGAGLATSRVTTKGMVTTEDMATKEGTALTMDMATMQFAEELRTREGTEDTEKEVIAVSLRAISANPAPPLWP